MLTQNTERLKTNLKNTLKRHLKKKIISLLVVLTLVISLVGCGGDNNTEITRKTGNEPQKESIETPVPSASPEVIDISTGNTTETKEKESIHKDELSSSILFSVRVCGKEDTDVTVDLFVTRSHKLYLQYGDELLDEKVIMTDEYNAILSAFDVDKLWDMELDYSAEVNQEDDVKIICLYDKKNEIYRILGGIGEVNSEFDEAHQTICSILPIDWALGYSHSKGLELAPIKWKVPRQGYDYFVSDLQYGHEPSDGYKLVEINKSSNNMEDRDEWLMNNQFPDPRFGTQEGYYIECGDYSIYRDGDEWTEPYKLIVYDKEFNTKYELDFSEYIWPDEYEQSESPYVQEYIYYAQISDDGKTLYVSISHSTYASSAKSNAYIIALDLENQVILWQSCPLVSNAFNFAVYDDVIFAGYGFTNEPDYIYCLDINYGTILLEQKVKSGPEFIFERENRLYVRTYDTDYIFDIVRE